MLGAVLPLPRCGADNTLVCDDNASDQLSSSRYVAEAEPAQSVEAEPAQSVERERARRMGGGHGRTCVISGRRSSPLPQSCWEDLF
jgi:hypothetical protein